jgi:methylmalonyl-CoA mutase
MTATGVTLASDFPTGTERIWRAAVERSGAHVEALATRTDEGIPIAPIYGRRVGSEPLPHRDGRWRIIQRVDGRNADDVVAICRTEIEGGADGVTLAFTGGAHPLGGTIPPVAVPTIATALAGMKGIAELRIEGGGDVATVTAAFDALAAKGVPVVVWCDPIAAGMGASRTDAGGLLADGRIWHAAGASAVQELAAALASLVVQLRGNDRATPLAAVLAADSDQFLTIAKFRAARLLLMRLVEVAGLGAPVSIHAETAWRMMSRREPRMNTLRTTGAALAAAMGGADSITVLPHDVLDGGSEAGRRLARNTQLILAEEAQLHRFADPGAGSGAVEALTDALAEAAWERFRRIEAEGGIAVPAARSAFLVEVAATRDARLSRVAAGEVEMVGVNAYANEKVQRTEVRDAHDRLAFRRLAEIVEGG